MLLTLPIPNINRIGGKYRLLQATLRPVSSVGGFTRLPSPIRQTLIVFSLSYQDQFVTFTITLLSLSYKIALQVPPSSSKSMQRQAHLFVGKQLRLSICLSFLGYL